VAPDSSLRSRIGVRAPVLLAGFALIGIACVLVGYQRIVGGEVGGGTLLVGGVLILLVLIAVFVGLASSRMTSVTKTYHRIPAMIGEDGVVKETIPAGRRGVVLVRNELWSATSASEILVGTRIKIVKTDGILLYVERSAD